MLMHCRSSQHTMWWHLRTAVIRIYAESWQRIWHANDIHGVKYAWHYLWKSGDYMSRHYFSWWM